MRVPLIEPQKPTWIATERHHIYGGNPNRKHSEKYKCVIYLTPEDHRGTNGIHRNREMRLRIQAECQQKLEDAGWTREEFRETFGKSYL